MTPTALVPTADLHLLDGEGVLFDEAAQELHSVNAPATLLWCCLEEGLTQEAIAVRFASSFGVTLGEATSISERQLREWRDRGYWKAGEEELGKRAPERDVREVHTAPGARGRSYRLLGTEFRVSVPAPLKETLAEAFGSLLGTESEGVAVELAVEPASRGFLLRENGTQRALTGTEQGVIPMLKEHLCRDAIARSPAVLVLHAGVVTNRGTCMLLPAAPGSGKTLLTAALLRDGWQYFSDELAVLEGGSYAVRAVPLSLAIKKGGVGPLEGFYPRIGKLRLHLRGDGRQVRYFAPPANSRARTDSAQARWIVFPRFDPDRPTRRNPVSRPEALRRLLEECIAVPHRLTRDDAAGLIDWIRKTECFELTYASLAEALPLFRPLLKSDQAGRAT